MRVRTQYVRPLSLSPSLSRKKPDAHLARARRSGEEYQRKRLNLLKIVAMPSCATLSAKQSKFVSEYLVDGNGTRSAVAAGYGRAGARTTASRTLASVHVQRALQARQSADASLPACLSQRKRG